MAIRDRWNRFIRRSDSSTSTMDSNVLSKTFSWRASKASTSTAAASTASSYSDRGLGSSGSGIKTDSGVNAQPGAVSLHAAPPSSSHLDRTIDCPGSGQSKTCNKMPTLDDSSETSLRDDTGLAWSDMTESQRHQARLDAFTIKFGATRSRRLSFEEISPCNTRRPSLEMGP
ncbi:hypothetical protein SCUCBS95973_007617 [Sporothrix curviconia]|uniref:Uncharacterized protein n=1 Tax=Sporothrix curviconia TaxID=1260050 RepID=A0ABP0CH82_9PEZI